MAGPRSLIVHIAAPNEAADAPIASKASNRRTLTMQITRTRGLAAAAASLAFVMAGTASVAAHPGDEEGPFGFGRGDRGGLFRDRLEMRGLVRGAWDGLVRSETTYQTDEGALVTQRIDNGTLSVATETSVDYTLATDEAATVALDEETQVIGFTTESVDFGRGFERQRMVGESIAVTDIAAGSEIVVWASSQEDGSFLAQRIVVRPTVEETDDEATTEDDAAAEDTTEVAPAASPDPAASPATDA
jgi:hypothetical protein